MEAFTIGLIAIGVVGALGILWAGFLLDRRSHRIQSAKWMRGWTILTRVRADLFSRLHGPLRLQDQRSEGAPPKKTRRKPATLRRKRPRKPSR